MQVRSFDNAFTLTDYTQELNIIPNTWGLVNELGIFRNEPVAQHSITIESAEGTLGLILDQPRGARNNTNKDDTRKLFSFPVPHFPLDDYITPSDVQGKRAYADPNAPETKDLVIARKLQRIRASHAATLEAARCYALTTGAIYAPNGTVAANYYTDFGVVRKTIDFVFGTATTDLIAKGEEGIAHIQDNILSGESVNEMVALCSPGFFSKLIAHATVKEAYKYYSSTQEPLRKRLGSGVYRQFEFGGITYIEYRGAYNGTALIPAGDAYLLPRGTNDTFVSYFGPANKFSHVNTLGEEVYAFLYGDQRDEQETIQTESNHLHLVRRPATVVRLHSST